MLEQALGLDATSAAALVSWLVLNVALSLVSIPLVLIGSWLIVRSLSLFAIIRDGQLCFYCTTTIAAFVHDATSAGRAGEVVIPAMFLMILTTFVYGVAAVHLQPHAGAESSQIDRRIGWVSILCTIATTLMVATGRLQMGLLR